MPVEISGGTLSGGTTIGSSPTSGIDTGSPTGGYDVLGMGIVDPAVAGRASRGDLGIGVSQSDNEQYVAALQERANKQLEQQAIQRLQQAGLPKTIQQGFAAGTSPFAQLSARGNLNQLPNIGILSALNKLGQRTASGIMERIQAGGIPVYDKTGQIVGARVRSDVGDKAMGFLGEKFGFEPEPQYTYFGRGDFDVNQATPITDQFGNIIGYETAPSIMQDDGGEPYVAPEVTVAEAEPEPVDTTRGYVYPAGGIYPTEGEYMRTGLLDIAPTQYGGLLAGYDPTQFGAMNVGFRQPINVGAYPDPFDVTGYTLI